MERLPHRGSVPMSTHQPKRILCSPTGACGGWKLRLRLWKVRAHGEDWGWLREHGLKGTSVPELAWRESRKKSGTAEEGRLFLVPLFYGVLGEGFKSTA